MKSLFNKYQNLDHLQRQKINKIVLYITIGAVILIAIFTSSNNSLKTSQGVSKDKKNPYMNIVNIADEISLEDKWLAHKDNQIQELKSTSESLKVQNQQLKEKLDSISSKLETYIEDDDSDYIRNEIEALKAQRIKNQKEKNNLTANINSNNNPVTNRYNRYYDKKYLNNGSNPFSRNSQNLNNTYNNNQENVIKSTPEASQIDIVYINQKDQLKHYDPKFYLPAGSYASAILISSVDASTSINSQSDPRQVLFRVTTKAKSAKQINNYNQKKDNVTINIDGCTITGASYGDLSSERAYVRLLKMTCSRNGKIIETDVEGYASDGSDGKTGLAGKVISREGDLLAKSFVAGIVSGVGSGIAKKFDPTVSVADGYTNINTLSNKQIAGQGLSEGISKSSQNLSDYLIKRAEQYQPVISVASGKKVELVFISGVYLDGRIIKKKSTNNSNMEKTAYNQNYLRNNNNN